MHSGTSAKKALAMMLLCAAISGCASTRADTAPDGMLTGSVFSVNCEFGWSDCYSEAQRRCPSGRFDEIDRAAIEQTFNDRDDYRKANLPGKPVNRSIVVRCK